MFVVYFEHEFAFILSKYYTMDIDTKFYFAIYYTFQASHSKQLNCHELPSYIAATIVIISHQVSVVFFFKAKWDLQKIIVMCNVEKNFLFYADILQGVQKWTTW